MPIFAAAFHFGDDTVLPNQSYTKILGTSIVFYGAATHQGRPSVKAYKQTKNLAHNGCLTLAFSLSNWLDQLS